MMLYNMHVLNYHTGHLPLDRAQRKRQQIENMVDHVRQLITGGSDVIVDFCAGGVSTRGIIVVIMCCIATQGHLGIALAYSYPQCKVGHQH